MAFLLVLVKDGFHFVVERLVYLLELFRYVLVNGTLAYSELPRGRSDGRVVFYDKFSEYNTSFLFTCRGIFQMLSPPAKYAFNVRKCFRSRSAFDVIQYIIC